MIIAFCGQSQIFCELDIIDKILQILNIETKDAKTVEFYMGHHGWFDDIAMMSCKKYKRLVNDSAKTCLILPYAQSDSGSAKYNEFDEIISPGLDNLPKNQVTSARNKWIIDKADFVIAYVNDRGGAQRALDYAIESNKRVINLGTYSK